MKYISLLFALFLTTETVLAQNSLEQNSLEADRKLALEARTAAKNGEEERGVRVALQIEKDLFRQQVVAGITTELMEAGKSGKAVKVLKPIVDSLAKRVRTDSLNKQVKVHYNNYSLMYVKALYGTGNTSEAFKYMEPLYSSTAHKTIDFMELYIKLLDATGKQETVVLVAQTLWLDGSASGTVKELFRKAYLKNNGTEKRYKNLSDSIELVLRNKIRSKLKGELIKKPSSDFILKDLDGNEVTLSKLRGKTIVIDFWATWCGPCKKSFPAMQQAVSRYKKDSSVVFLFIHTWEREADATIAARKYIEDNKYSFKVLMDLKDPVTNKNMAIAGYDVPGIPAKFVIDKNGNIRFRIIGSDPKHSDDTIADEIAAMIEMAKDA